MTTHGRTRRRGSLVASLVAMLVVALTASACEFGHVRPVQGIWFLRNSNSGGPASVDFRFGAPGEYRGYNFIRGDWDGDGDDTLGLFDLESRTFFLKNGNTDGAADLTFRFGPRDRFLVPVAGDWNGDGADTIGVVDLATHRWYLRNTNSAGSAAASFQFGTSGDVPSPGDWDGNGIDTVGVFRPRAGTWHLRNSNSAGTASTPPFAYGRQYLYDPQDTRTGCPCPYPVVGDWDGDGRDTIGIWDGWTKRWYLRNRSSSGSTSIPPFTYSPRANWPIAGDWDGNGTDTVGIGK